MTNRVERACGAAAALLSLALVLLAVPAAAPADLAALGAAVAVLLVTVALLRGLDVQVLVPAGAGDRGPTADERHLRGAFRRQSSPDSPGRPRPRAPGSGPRPA